MRSVIHAALWYALIVCVSTIACAKDIQIAATPIEIFLPEKPKQTHFGHLEFLGGLALTSRNDDFGGMSGLRLDAEGNNLFAVTDKGHFFKASLKRDISGKIIALENAEISRLRNSKGKKLKGRRNTDAESLEISGNQFLVGFERNHRVVFFNLKPGN